MIAAAFCNALVASNGDPNLREGVFDTFEPLLKVDEEVSPSLNLTFFMDQSVAIACTHQGECHLYTTTLEELPTLLHEAIKIDPSLREPIFQWMLHMLHEVNTHESAQLPG
jgi:hypothetical protein